MSSKAFFQSSVKPQLIYRRIVGGHRNRAVEVWTTSCIVTNFGQTSAAACTCLINPSNPQLAGCRNFPYFPRGGPVPNKVDSMHKDWQPLGFVSQWGGMDVGHGMLFPVSVIDGLVHLHGGWKLQAECQWHRLKTNEPCPVGAAVETSAHGRLSEWYETIVHTTPPFYDTHDNTITKLAQCYASAFNLAFGSHDRVAVPLLGSGARGFPYDVAIRVAADASVNWLQEDMTEPKTKDQPEQVVVFGLLEKRLAEELAGLIDDKFH